MEKAPKWVDIINALSEQKQQQFIEWLQANTGASPQAVNAKAEEFANART